MTSLKSYSAVIAKTDGIFSFSMDFFKQKKTPPNQILQIYV